MTELSYNLHRPWLSLDEWQREYINTKENCFLLCGRQVGKSTAASLKVAELAAHRENQDILIIATTEKQAYELFFKALNYLEQVYPEKILRGREKPTKHEIRFKNGSIIRCHACGQTGEGLRGYTCTRIVVDEAARMNKEIFQAIIPMLSVTGGALDLLSTPAGKEGYFYEASLRDDFKKFYVSAEDCPRHDKKHLEMVKATMSSLEYAQEYLAVFLDELKRLFSDELIGRCCVLKRGSFPKNRNYYLGVDVARLGEDESTFEIISKINDDTCEQVDSIITKKQLITQTTEKIIQLDKIYDFIKIGIDDGGVGAGVFDNLMKAEEVRIKTIPLNNARRPLDREGKKAKRLLKEDMYFNLLYMLEKGILKLLDDDELILSLKSIQYEYVIKEGRNSQLRIFGSYTHIVEGLIRAAWNISQDKSLNIWCASKSYGV